MSHSRRAVITIAKLIDENHQHAAPAKDNPLFVVLNQRLGTSKPWLASFE
jgi:hypothetical protein